MITWEDLNVGYLSGRNGAYDHLPSARVQQSIPFARVTPLNRGGFTPMEMMIRQEQPELNLVAEPPSPPGPVRGGMSGIGDQLKKWGPIAAAAVLAIVLLRKK